MRAVWSYIEAIRSGMQTESRRRNTARHDSSGSTEIKYMHNRRISNRNQFAIIFEIEKRRDSIVSIKLFIANSY